MLSLPATRGHREKVTVSKPGGALIGSGIGQRLDLGLPASRRLGNQWLLSNPPSLWRVFRAALADEYGVSGTFFTGLH